MKNYFIGLFLSSTLLSLSTVAFASGNQATLFPSRVAFHFKSAIKWIDGAEVLNYNNKAYVPLRNFSEVMGTYVNFQPASNDTGNMNLIDIYDSGSSSNSNQSDLRISTNDTETVQVSLFPSKLKFHVNNTVRSIESSDVLNYNNRSYIPLRSFSEAMGSSVNFQAASKDTGNVNLIDIYDSGSDLLWKDSDGYVNMGDLQAIPVNDNQNAITSGTIQVNNDLTGKAIDIDLYDKSGELIGKSDFVFIDNQDIQPPQVGDIRSFKTYILFDKGHEIGSCKTNVHDILKPVKNPDIDKINGDPIAILFYPPFGYSDDSHGLAIGDVHTSLFQLYNSSDSTITLNPVNFEFDVFKADDQNPIVPVGDPVYTFKIPVISGPILSKAGYELQIPWNQRGLDGNLITEGKYVVQLKATSDLFQYKNEGSNEIKTFDFNANTHMGHSYAVLYSN